MYHRCLSFRELVNELGNGNLHYCEINSASHRLVVGNLINAGVALNFKFNHSVSSSTNLFEVNVGKWGVKDNS